jgi:hypothetical protein
MSIIQPELMPAEELNPRELTIKFEGRRASFMGARRASMKPVARRMSKAQINEEITEFLNTKGITERDIEDAMALLSSNGKRINQADLDGFVAKYCGKFKRFKIREEINRDYLIDMLLQNESARPKFDETFEVRATNQALRTRKRAFNQIRASQDLHTIQFNDRV